MIETDASNVGISVVLMQAKHLISYYSKKLGIWLRVASTYVKELHAMTEAVRKWRQYPLGRFFMIRTDHCSIKELFQQVIHTPEQRTYIQKLMGYNFKIEYKPGRTNAAANALSRMYEDTVASIDQSQVSCFQIFSQPVCELLEVLREENETDPELSQLHQQIKGPSPPANYLINNGLMLYQGRFVVGANSGLKSVILREFHSTPWAGHTRVKCTATRIVDVSIGQNYDVILKLMLLLA